jgi:hypothetical protein
VLNFISNAFAESEAAAAALRKKSNLIFTNILNQIELKFLL